MACMLSAWLCVSNLESGVISGHRSTDISTCAGDMFDVEFDHAE